MRSALPLFSDRVHAGAGGTACGAARWKKRIGKVVITGIALAAWEAPVSAGERVDDEAALAIARKEHCLRCHSITKRKNAPSYREIAAKYGERPDAEAKLIKHLVDAPIVKTDDGDERHMSLPTRNDEELRNLVRWVLSR